MNEQALHPTLLKLRSVEIAERAEALLSQMSLAQKAGQMTQAERMAITPEEVKSFHIGSVLSGGGSCPGNNLPTDWVEMNDAYWAASTEGGDGFLSIPIVYGVDAIHGHNNVRGATIFPHNIGLGAAHDPELIERIARITAKEVLATGVDWTFAPTLAVARDPHWGRTYESYSDQPTLVSDYAPRFIDGLQSDLRDDSLIACTKHWVGDGGTSHGIDQGDTELSWKELEAIHMPPYYPALNAGALTVMASFNSWNGDKCHGHRQLLTEVLKGELGFSGFVISDWDGIDYLAENYFEAIGMGVNAGIDMFMVSENWSEFISHLIHHVEQGSVAMQRVDDAVLRILKVKLVAGLFEKPRPKQRKWSNHASFGSAEHRAVAREAVQKSQVLLKNDSSCLPLQRSSRILVAGRNANNTGHQCGGFTIAWQGTSGNDTIEGGTSIWEGIRAQTSNAVLSVDGSAVEADAQAFDVAVVVIGESPYAEGMGDIRDGDDVIVEAGSRIRGMMKVLEPYGDSLALARLHPEDLQVIQRIKRQGIPVVTVLISGRSLLIEPELAGSDAFVASWLPGSEGNGVSDVLFGDALFTGKLSMNWHGTNGDLLFGRGFGLETA